ncbi:DUF3108 domain-containing protein [Rubrivivax gelatinosus]|uniref:DUF3108 domain-containing protein n=1 Tax=Rubrivivax gelatinosus TaxID=28068 RepID=UPI00104D1B4A
MSPPRRSRRWPAAAALAAGLAALHLVLLDALNRPPVAGRTVSPVAGVVLVPVAQPLPPPAEPRPRRVAPRALDPAAVLAPPPLYAVQLPPPQQLRWQRRRGEAEDELRLDFEHDAAGYRLELADGAGDGWASRGTVGVHGLEPERLVERRRQRDVRAANFRRELGRISFSGGAGEQPLQPGAQDRLSWLLQLAGVVAAAPQRFGPGAAVELFVAGARGDAGWRRFEVRGVEPLALPAGPVLAALRLESAAQRPYEPALEVWLDPARGWLPVRWRSRVAETGAEADHRLLAAGS